VLTPQQGQKFTIPGVSTVDVDPEQRLDVNKPKGRPGASITDDGPAPAKVKIKTTLSTKEEWEAFQAIAFYFRPSGNIGNVQKLDIQHPVAALWGVRSILPHKIKGPKYTKDGYVIEIDCYEYFPPKKDVTRTIGSRDPGKVPQNVLQQRADGSYANPPPSSTVASRPPVPAGGARGFFGR